MDYTCLAELKMKAIFNHKSIELPDYPIRVAGIAETEKIEAMKIREVRLDRDPLEIMLSGGEVIFLDRKDLIHLETFSQINFLRIIHRPDVWSMLLEPFLDAHHPPEVEARTLLNLKRAGFPENEVEKIRKKVGRAVGKYNSEKWESAHLSHYDLLLAYGLNRKLLSLPIFGNKKEIYNFSNEISNKSPAANGKLPEYDTSLETKLSELCFYFATKYEKTDFDSLHRGLWRKLKLAYSMGDRNYHNLEHIARTLELADSMLPENTPDDDRNVLHIAVLFHDIVYDPKEKNNEQASAEQLEEFFKDIIPSPLINEAKKLVMVTENRASAQTETERLMADIDMAILAADRKSYNEYRANIRKEYSHVNDAVFNEERMKFLTVLDERIKKEGKLFFNMHPMYEAQAKSNISFELDAIEKSIYGT